jgi:WD40 repeat protein
MLKQRKVQASDAKPWGFVQDARRLIVDYKANIEQFPLAIYSIAQRCLRSGSIEEIHIPGSPAWSGLHCDEVRGTLTTILEGHTAMVSHLAFSPDSKLLATASFDRTVRLWDLASRKTLRVLEQNNLVKAIAFSPDGYFLASASNNMANDWSINIWDLASGKEVNTQNPIGSMGYVYSIAFSPNGKMLASAASKGMVRLWDAATGWSLRILLYDSVRARDIAFSADGKLLASAWEDGVVKLWDPHTGCEMGTFVAHNGCTSAIAFSPDGQLLASASFDDNIVKIWDPATGTKLQTSLGHIEGITSIAFSPDGLLASSSYDKTVTLWDPSTGMRKGKLVGCGVGAWAIAFSPDGSLLACTTDAFELGGSSIDKSTVGLWELHSRT